MNDKHLDIAAVVPRVNYAAPDTLPRRDAQLVDHANTRYSNKEPGLETQFFLAFLALLACGGLGFGVWMIVSMWDGRWGTIASILIVSLLFGFVMLKFRDSFTGDRLPVLAVTEAGVTERRWADVYRDVQLAAIALNKTELETFNSERQREFELKQAHYASQQGQIEGTVAVAQLIELVEEIKGERALPKPPTTFVQHTNKEDAVAAAKFLERIYVTNEYFTNADPAKDRKLGNNAGWKHLPKEQQDLLLEGAIEVIPGGHRLVFPVMKDGLDSIPGFVGLP